jgi:hypothetical protein
VRGALGSSLEQVTVRVEEVDGCAHATGAALHPGARVAAHVVEGAAVADPAGLDPGEGALELGGRHGKGQVLPSARSRRRELQDGCALAPAVRARRPRRPLLAPPALWACGSHAEPLPALGIACANLAATSFSIAASVDRSRVTWARSARRALRPHGGPGGRSREITSHGVRT